MIIPNGTISVKEILGKNHDTDGKPSVLWSQPIPCRIVTIKEDRLANKDGNKYTDASYKVFIELQPFIRNGQVRLTRLDEDLGDFSVKNTIPEDAVGMLTIIV